MEPTNESRTESFIMQIISKEKNGGDSKRANRLSGGLPISERSRSYNQQVAHMNHDDSWNFNHSKFQDEFAMDDKSSRRILPAHSDLLRKKLEEYEEVFRIWDHKTQKDKEELEKLQKKPALSPSSKKRKLDLESWVAKDEREKSQKKKKYTENLELIENRID